MAVNETFLSERRAHDADTAVKEQTHGRYVSSTESFTFSHRQEWPKWICRIRSVTGLNQREDEVQVNTLTYMVGDKADDFLRSFKFSDKYKKKYQW